MKDAVLLPFVRVGAHTHALTRTNHTSSFLTRAPFTPHTLHAHTHTHLCTHKYVYLHIHAYTWSHTCAHIHDTYIHTRMYVHVHVRMHTYRHTNIHIYTCTYTHTHKLGRMLCSHTVTRTHSHPCTPTYTYTLARWAHWVLLHLERPAPWVSSPGAVQEAVQSCFQDTGPRQAPDRDPGTLRRLGPSAAGPRLRPDVQSVRVLDPPLQA